MCVMSDISIRAERLFTIAHWPVTNALLLSCVALVVLVVVALALKRKLSLIPSTFQSIFEVILEQILALMDSVLGARELSEKYLPLVATVFLFVITSNWLGLLPGVGTIGIRGASEAGSGAGGTLIPLFRSPSSDLNFTIVLAVISVTSVNLFGALAIGFWKHLGKFFTIKGPIDLFIGVLEFIAEFVKIVSFSFRLFGNVFAGEVLLTIIGSLTPYIVPLPFLFLEVFVGFIQAFIFAMLTLVFMAIAIQDHSHEEAVGDAHH